jgi:hypothetical protein
MVKVKLNKDLQDKICKDIEQGTPMKYASISNGICKSTFYNWYNKGKEAKSGKYHNFYAEIEKAKSKAITLKCEFIHKESKENWHACAWWLERVAPEEFLKKEQYQIEAKVNEDAGLEALGDAISMGVSDNLIQALRGNGKKQE